MGQDSESRTRSFGSLEVRIATERSRILVEAAGEIDLATEPLLTMEMLRVESGAESAEIVLDLEGVRFMDSTGIGAILDAHRRSRASARRLRIRGLQGHVRRVLDATGVSAVLREEGALVV
jgi:anti-anti-sigma factor